MKVLVNCYKQTTMKHNVLIAAGITGILLGTIPVDTHAEVKARLDHTYIALGDSPTVVINAPPTFVYVPELGYSVAVDTPYDYMYYDNLYYLYNNGYWYSAMYYDGPWLYLMEDRLPPVIRGHHLSEIRRFRDNEYRKHDRQYWQDRDIHDRKSQRDVHINSNRGTFEGRGRGDGRSRNDDDGRNPVDGRGFGDGRTGFDTRSFGDGRGGGEGHGPGGGHGGGAGGGHGH